MSENIVVGAVEKPTPEELAGVYETFDRQAGKIKGQLKAGELTTAQVQAFVEGRNPFRQERERRAHPLTFGDAIDILGPDKVLTPKQQARVWDCSVSAFSNRHLCPERFLLEAAAENRDGQDWHLIFIPPVTYLQAYEKMEKLSLRSKFLSGDDNTHWATVAFGPRVELLNFSGCYSSENWFEQEMRIQRLECKRRAHDLAITIGALSYYQVNDGEYLFRNWYHWGTTHTAKHNRVFVGFFSADCWGVGEADPASGSTGTDTLRVCLAWEFHNGLLPA